MQLEKSNGTTVSDLIAGMEIEKWNNSFDNSRLTGVQVDLPKFKYDFKDLLPFLLKQTGPSYT